MLSDFLHAGDQLMRRAVASPKGIPDSLGCERGGTVGVSSLIPRWVDIVAALPALGDVSALTDSDHMAMVATGRYSGLRFLSSEQACVARTSGSIDVRFTFAHWAKGFAVQKPLQDGGSQQSLQFFDAFDRPIHKVYLTSQSNAGAFADLLDKFAVAQPWADDQNAVPSRRTSAVASRGVDVEAFRDQWVSMRDTFDFHGLLGRFGLTRLDALRLAPANYAAPISTASAYEVLSLSAQHGVAIRVLAGNPGAVQIHTGRLVHVDVTGAWINVGDRRFCLQLREDHIASAWLVKKPTANGLVHSVELYDDRGEPIAMLFGDRKPGRPEPCEWRQLLSWLTPEVAACAI